MIKSPNASAVAHELLRSNRVTSARNGKTYRYTRPAPSIYEQQWLWDSCFHAIALRWLDPAMAWDELDATVAHQHEDGPDEGMVPHMSYWAGGGEKIWGHDSRSIITQPPLIAVAAMRVFARDPAMHQLAALYPRLQRFHNWFGRRRDVLGDGTVAIIHPWEGGNDASPRWDAPMGLSGEQIRANDATSGVPDMAAANYYQNNHDNALREARMALVQHLRAHNCNARALSKAGHFCLVPLDFNCYRLYDLRAMQAMAMALGKPADAAAYDSQIEQLIASLQRHFFGGERVMATDVLVNRGISKQFENGSAPLMALLGACASKAQLEAVCRRAAEVIESPGVLPIPTTPPESPAFAPGRYWRGNVWLPINWLVWMGLRDCGRHTLARMLAERTIALVQQRGLHEYFNPITGEGHGSSPHSWDALILDMQMEEGL